MHRLWQTKIFQSKNSYSNICHGHQIYCLIIFRIMSHTQMRYQTSINSAVLSMQLRSKRKSKKYAELLEVTDNNAHEQKAAIKKLSASQLSLLVSQPNITLDKIHQLKLKYGSKSRPNLKLYQTNKSPSRSEKVLLCSSQDDKDSIDTVSMMEDLKSSGIYDPACIIKSASLLNSCPQEHVDHEAEDENDILQSDTCKTNGKKLVKKEKKNKDTVESEKFKNLQLSMQRESLTRTLNAYLRVCITCGMIGRAYYTVMHYRKINPHNIKSIAIRDIELYNILLEAYASQGNLEKVKEFMRIIHEDQLEPTAKTYSALFECFGNLSNPTKDLQFLMQMQRKMLQKNITLDSVLNDSKYRLKQYDSVLKGILLLNPSFKSAKIKSDEGYNCHLLKELVSDKTTYPSPVENTITLADVDNMYKQQVINEMNGYVDIKSIEKFDRTENSLHYKNEILRLELQWTKIISAAFDRDLKALKNREHKPIPNAMVLYPCLCVLDKNEYIKATLHEIRRLADGSETYSPSLTSLCRRLGKYINEKYELLERKNNGYVDVMDIIYKEYCNQYIDGKISANNRLTWDRIANKLSHHYSLELESIAWPLSLQIAVGKFLYDIILKDIKLHTSSLRPERTQKRIFPAFYTLFRTNSNKHLIEEIKPHPILSKIYRESQPETLTFETSLIPSECPPRPWSSIRNGGYLLLKTDVMRVPLHSMKQWKRLENTDPKQLWPALDCLNQLASVPWTVNNRILDLAIDIFRSGGCAQLNVPQPSSVLVPVALLRLDSSPIDRKMIIKARMEFKRRKNEMYSLWCDALYRLSLANHFRDKIFWLPHNMDFRGRVYPVPPHLNHLGSDLARSILIFALGKPLGPNGLDWLKIHAINLTGLKKRNSLAERLEYANENLDKILDSAENPMNGERWWAQSDEPWQTLATCVEISQALKCPNPEEYICRFPVHQDGSCNGLQHYAALGRDQVGAESVNLYPSDTPQDVYTNVASMVDDIRRKDAEDGIEIAKILENFVKRKIVKQTVMTTVYGVTRFGARLQIARQLKDLDDFPQEHVWSGSLYLAQKTFESLRTMFESAKKIQDWFTDCARVVPIIKGENMEWITPLGLPVVQPYSKVLPTKSLFKDIPIDSLQRPNTSKQKNAFAPNFIHSLDSCHMMLTSLHCENVGITFVSVHDCYWTHPCSVEIMNKVCREQFVALHSEPILENLSKFFISKYIDNKTNSSTDDTQNLETILGERKLYYTLTNVPRKGQFMLEKVMDSTYFFS